MAKAYISEYDKLIIDKDGRITAVAAEPATLIQVVEFTTSAQSADFHVNTRFVRVIAEAKAHFLFGRDPTATANNSYLPADVQEYFGVIRGQPLKIAFYDGSS